jgi:hypothetical protein
VKKHECRTDAASAATRQVSVSGCCRHVHDLRCDPGVRIFGASRVKKHKDSISKLLLRRPAHRTLRCVYFFPRMIRFLQFLQCRWVAHFLSLPFHFRNHIPPSWRLRSSERENLSEKTAPASRRLSSRVGKLLAFYLTKIPV